MGILVGKLKTSDLTTRGLVIIIIETKMIRTHITDFNYINIFFSRA